MNQFDKLLKKPDQNFNLGKYKQAIEQYFQYTETNKEDPQVWKKLAYAYNYI